MHEVVTVPRERCGPLPTDDAILVEAARRHASAFEPLYGRYRDRIYAYIRLRTRTAEDAADLTQQAFLQALGALPQYRVQRGTFAAWLFRIAHNVATDDARRRRVTISWDLVPEALQPLAGDDTEAAVLITAPIAPTRLMPVSGVGHAGGVTVTLARLEVTRAATRVYLHIAGIGTPFGPGADMFHLPVDLAIPSGSLHPSPGLYTTSRQGKIYYRGWVASTTGFFRPTDTTLDLYEESDIAGAGGCRRRLTHPSHVRYRASCATLLRIL